MNLLEPYCFQNEDEEFFRIHFLCDDETKSIFAEINQVLIQLKKHEKNKKRWKKLSVLQKSVKKFHYWESCGLNSAEFIILEKWNIPTQILMKKAVRQNIVDFFKNNDVKKIMELTQQNHQVKEVVKSENDSTSNKSDEVSQAFSVLHINNNIIVTHIPFFQECPKIDGVLLRRPTRKAPVPPKSCPTIAVVEPEKFSSMPPPPPPLPILSFPRSSQDTLDLHDGIKCKQLRRASCPENKPTDIHSQLMDAVRCFNKNKLESVPKDLNENRDLDPRDELLMNIKNFNLRSLKPVLPGNSGAGTPETETDSQDKLLNEILNFDRKKLKPFKNNEETPTAKFRKFDSGIFSDELMTKLKGRREDIDSSDSESDGESSDFDDEWED